MVHRAGDARVASGFGGGLSLLASRSREAFSALHVAARNVDIRRAELAWGALMSAEWAHFVALGVFAYGHGGSTAVGVAGLLRLLPAAAIAPFAVVARRPLPAGAVPARPRAARSGCARRLGGRRARWTSGAIVFVAGSVVGVCSTLFRPALDRAASVAGANGARADRRQRSHLDDREPRHPARAARRRTCSSQSPTSRRSSSRPPRPSSSRPPCWPGSRSRGASRRAPSGARAEVWQGFRAIGEVPRARLLVGLIASQTFVRGCLNVLIVVTAYQVLDTGATEVGYLTAAIGAGGLLGALGAISLRGERLAPPFAWAIVFWGIPIMLIAPLSHAVPIIALLAVVGAANSVVDVSGFTLLQRTVPDEVLTRVLGVTWGLAMGTAAIGSFVAPAVLDLIGLRPAFLVVGAILPVLVLVTHRQLLEIDTEVAPAPQLSLIEDVALFAPLSLVTKERIASHLVQVDVAAGDVVIRAGDLGDRFYVVGTGELTIDAGTPSFPPARETSSARLLDAAPAGARSPAPVAGAHGDGR